MIELNKKRKSPGNSQKRPNKKQRIDDYQTIEITKKTTHNKPQQDPGDEAPFGPKDNGCVDEFFISNDDIFQKVKEKENKKYQISLNKHSSTPSSSHKNSTDDLVNKMNLSLCDLLNNVNTEGMEISEGEEEEAASDKSSCSSSSSQHSDNKIMTIVNHHEYSDDDSDDYSMLLPSRILLFEECFLCSWGNSEHDAIYSKNLAELKTIYMNNRGKIKNENLANMLHLYFMEHVYKPGTTMPILTPQMALEHMKNIGKSHTLNATEHIIESIELWTQVRDNIKHFMYHQDMKADKDQLNGLVTSQKMINSLYMMKPSTMSFRDPDCTINITKGPVFKIESLNENTERIIKTKKITQTNIRKKKTLDI